MEVSKEMRGYQAIADEMLDHTLRNWPAGRRIADPDASQCTCIADVMDVVKSCIEEDPALKALRERIQTRA